MARKVTQQVVSAFLGRRSRTVGSTKSTGDVLELHGNTIAMWRNGNADGSAWSLWITLAGWNTPTTRERLNGLPGVRVSTKAGQAYLNGAPWDGEWIKLA